MKKNQSELSDSVEESRDTLQPHLEASKNKIKAQFVIIGILGILLIVTLSISGCLVYQNDILRNQVSQELPSLLTHTTVPTPTVKPTAPATSTIEQESTKNLLSGSRPNKILAGWKTYEDPKLRFRFDNPNQYVLDLELEYPDPSWSKIALYEPSVHKWMEKDGPMGSAPGIYISVYEETKESPLMDMAKEIQYNTSFGMDKGTYEWKRIQEVNTVKYSDGEDVSYYLYLDHHLLIFANFGAPPEDFEKFISTVYLP